jgi:superfamily II DNA or RNA helicase
MAPVLTSAKQKKLYKHYLNLSPVQRFTLQIFALLYEPSSRETVRQCWPKAMLLQKHFKQQDVPSSKTFNDQIKPLITNDLLKSQRTSTAFCNPDILEVVIRDAVEMGTFKPIVMAIEEALPIPSYYGNHRQFRSQQQFLRELRIAIYRQSLAEITQLETEIRYAFWQPTITWPELLLEMLDSPFDADWMRSLSDEFFQIGMRGLLFDSMRRIRPATEVFELLEHYCENEPQPDSGLQLSYVEQLWLRGYLEEAEAAWATIKPTDLKSPTQKADYSALQGVFAYLGGEEAEAIAHFDKSLKAIGKPKASQVVWFEQSGSIVYFFALLADGSPAALSKAEKALLLIENYLDIWLGPCLPLLRALIHRQQGNIHSATTLANEAFKQKLKHNSEANIGLLGLIECYSLHWLEVDNAADWLCKHLPTLCESALAAGYGWIALEAAELLLHYQPDSQYGEIVEALREQADSLPLIDSIILKPTWELSLQALANLAPAPLRETKDPSVSAQPSFRLAWRFHLNNHEHWQLLPIEQKFSAKGGWTKGKPVALKRLYTKKSQPDYLSEQDQKICASMRVSQNNDYYYRSSTPDYSFKPEALVALVGHPYVFWDDDSGSNTRVEIVAGEPQLLVKRLGSDGGAFQGNRLQLELSPPVNDLPLRLVKETPTRVKVIPISEQHRRIGTVLGPNNQLTVPVQAEARVLEAIGAIASLVTIQSDIGGGVEAEEVPADATPHVHLLPAGEGLKVSILTHPFPQGGAYYPPGQGGETVIADVEGKRLQTRRDLQAEAQRAKDAIAACPVLLQYPTEAAPDSMEWLIDETSDCLELLLNLQNLGENVIIEWPEGEKFKVSKELGAGDFNFNIHRQQDWFEASGEVQINEHQVMDLQQLMLLLENSSGKFLPMANGEFLALTEAFRQRLKSLSRLSQRHGKGLRIHGLAALAMDDWISEADDWRIDQDWQDHIQQIKAAQSIEPTPPDTLQATLRDYQRDGYVWLSRLANWGVGACLADDMGLGKTLQGLAILLSRAADGPALVVAPTSVSMNWLAESERFSPSLRLHHLGEGDRANRQQLLDSLGPQDLLICSYGLIQQEDVGEMLAKINWQTIILDEAQAIKNHATKRSQAVMALSGAFKVIMTGTPVENHLGELWNLFRFINPGLLGSLENFNLRFANPIERDRDDSASESLRQLIRPFILRRTKDQVLRELPSRTEITLPVELSAQELAFYEALRREAVEKLNNSDAEHGARHLQVLAEIMKLRRACCNPSLVKPELAIPSTKLEQFGELIAELLDNGHKALVFSQFVDHLTILRKHLDEQKVVYQYLDGSTPAKKRKQAVDAFQNGEGDVFLISLKAGGSGLNLTAADYVIHMDPWWNPAVEDQASDRAHRIGQLRPVTIYRLVAKGTIEDKIVALHKTKRDLADSLLTGSDMSGKVSTDELLSLIQQ